MVLTLVLCAIGILLLLVIAYNMIQQYKQKQESDRRLTLSRQKHIIDEADELLLNAGRLPYTKTLVLLLQNRILDALRIVAQANPSLTSVQQRIQDITAQINYVQANYQNNEESVFRTPDSDRQALQMRAVQGAFATNGQADTVQRQRILLANQPQVMMEGAAGHHVVLGVHLEKAQVGPLFENLLEVFALEPQACAGRQARGARLNVVAGAVVQGVVHHRHSG